MLSYVLVHGLTIRNVAWTLGFAANALECRRKQYSVGNGIRMGTPNRGFNVRDAVGDGGGVHVVGVDEKGAAFDDYVGGYEYYQQFQTNTIAEPYIHNASYIKLRDISLSYDFANILNSKFLKGASIGFVARNLARFGLSKDNVHGWDPFELSGGYGESGQLPGTKSYGVNVKLTF